MTFQDLPAVNGSLNGLSALFLAAGYYFIRAKNVPMHRNCMIAAFATSTIFLACYITYHAYRVYALHVGPTRFMDPVWFRPIYLTILTTHTILAVIIVPMVIMTLSRGLRARYDAHRRIARWTWPLWMYVSVTGVLIYYLLYIKYPQH
jgi:uncharacterized membrane protein YozB (DUF420 family)